MYHRAEKITFPPTPDIQTDRHTYIHTYGRTLAFKSSFATKNHLMWYYNRPGPK